MLTTTDLGFLRRTEPSCWNASTAGQVPAATGAVLAWRSRAKLPHGTGPVCTSWTIPCQAVLVSKSCSRIELTQWHKISRNNAKITSCEFPLHLVQLPVASCEFRRLCRVQVLPGLHEQRVA